MLQQEESKFQNLLTQPTIGGERRKKEKKK